MRLEMLNLRCGYKDKTVVKAFTSSVESGELLCLLGPNGVGKTTLFKTILGLLKPQGGSIIIDGQSSAQITRKEYAKRIGYVPQQHQPQFPFTAIDVVVMGRTAHLGILGKPEKKDFSVALEVIDALEISHLRDRTYTELSGGERQMVLIARALAQEPDFLMLDEPTASLDFGNQVKVLRAINQMVESGLGVIMTTHVPDHAFQCNGQVALMQRENVILTGSAYDIITEENLRLAYGIDCKIMEYTYGGHRLCFCQPLI